ncbi:MAG: gamma-glutamyltransferase family protein [Anaeromyxobacteraceae bacterium]
MRPRSVIHARRGMVASAHPLATGIGVGVLADGGTAADAAIAVNAALGFLEPVSCGVGGDLFAIAWDAKARRVHAVNASGRAPRGLEAAAIPPAPDGTVPLFSPYAWTVPGAVDGWFALHARLGRLPMARLLAPAIRAAEEGEPVPRVIAASWAEQAPGFAETPGFAATFLPSGRAPREGEVFRNAALARTYRLVAEGGREAFYEGPIAAELARFSRESGGFLAEEDLAENRADWVEPISTTYRGWTLWELPPNGQGLAALEMANIVEAFDLGALGRASPDLWHLLVEAKKLAYEDRARHIGDPASGEVPLAWLLSKAYARGQAARIDPARAARELPPRDPPFTSGDTTILAAADAEGNLVALIQSNYTGFGSGHAVPGLGFGLQNRGGQFDLRPGRVNSYAPGRRPFHTIIPALLGRGGEPHVAFGLMGGDMQAQGHVQVLVNLVDFGMDLQAAGDAARFYHTGSSEPDGRAMREGGLLALEPEVPADVVRELARRGHVLRDAPTYQYGGYQAVARDPATGVLSGATESRKDGCAMGW